MFGCSPKQVTVAIRFKPALSTGIWVVRPNLWRCRPDMTGHTHVGARTRNTNNARKPMMHNSEDAPRNPEQNLHENFETPKISAIYCLMVTKQKEGYCTKNDSKCWSSSIFQALNHEDDKPTLQLIHPPCFLRPPFKKKAPPVPSIEEI